MSLGVRTRVRHSPSQHMLGVEEPANAKRPTKLSPCPSTQLSSSNGEAIHSLITGASGFIGFQLAKRLLLAGKRVRLYVRNPAAVAELERLGAEVVHGDLDDLENLIRAAKNVGTVFHLAAMTSATDAQQQLRVNGDGTRCVARACASQQRPPVLVYVSSIAAAGPTARGRVRNELDPPIPVSDYGRSKLAGEQAAAEFAMEVPVSIVRPAIVYGPTNQEMLPIFRTIAYFRIHPVVGFNSPSLSFIYIDDFLDLLLLVANRGSRLPAPCGNAEKQLTAGRGVYFANGPEHPDCAELGRMLRGLLHRPWAPIVHLPVRLVWLFAGIHELAMRLKGASDTFNRDKIREAKPESWACSAGLALSDLGFKAPIPLSDRLKTTIDWYHEKRWL